LVFLSPGRRISREVACETLFGYLGPRAAANALYNALSMARGVLAALGGPAADMLGADRTHIFVSPGSPLEVDLEVHQTALRTALQMPPGTDRDDALARALSEEGVLLEDEAYPDWSLRPREHLEMLRQEGRLALARDRSRGVGRSGPGPVAQAWEAVLAHEPASEEAAAALMRSYAAQGQRHLVVRTYQRCRTGLEELGLGTSAALEETYAGATREAARRSLEHAEPANNLPGSLSSFVGRGAELAEVRSLVGSSRLVTLTGAGGAGKTRLALEVATQLLGASYQGALFVDLAPVAGADQVPGALASALGAREQAGRPLLEVLTEVLKDQDLLIVLDNCEHVIDAAAQLAERLNRNCPKVHLLVTSRQPLGIGGERLYRVPPLSLPAEAASSLEEVEGSDAVELFMERARDQGATVFLEGPSVGLVASICRRLDGMPFAIELAAARLASMSLVHLHDRLDQRFRLLTGGARTALPRQQTLQATLDWSFDLLSGPEQAVLCRLSVFPGSFELEAAEAVCATELVPAPEVADLVGSLVNKSLVVAERSPGSLRYRLLETIRQYAGERLVATSGELGARQVQTAHAQFYLALAETAAPELSFGGPLQGAWYRRFDLEWDNVRTALAYLYAEPDRTEEVLRLGVALSCFLGSRNHLDAIGALRAALERPGPVPASLRARAFCFVGSIVAVVQGFESRPEMRAARELLQQGLGMARELDDPELVALVLSDLGWVAEFQGESSQAALFAEEALDVARSVGNPGLIGYALGDLALVAPTPEEKRALWLEALACERQAGDVNSCIAQISPLAQLELDAGRLGAARALYEEAVAAAEDVGSPWVLGDEGGHLGFVLLLQGEPEEAALWCRKALVAFRRAGRRKAAVTAIFKLACCATGMGDYLLAARLTGAHDVIHAAYIDDDVAPAGAYRWNKWGPLEQRVWDDNRARLRQVLGEAEFERVYAVGRGLSFDQAADLALGRAVLGLAPSGAERAP
jgi:predicted ATPase/DNA-binding SARP family transcriptional activator